MSDENIRALMLVEELAIEGNMVEHRRGELYRLARKEIISLTAQLAEAEKDAGRYRWLRNESQSADDDTPTVMSINANYPAAHVIEGEELDAAIDAAIAGELP